MSPQKQASPLSFLIQWCIIFLIVWDCDSTCCQKATGKSVKKQSSRQGLETPNSRLQCEQLLDAAGISQRVQQDLAAQISNSCITLNAITSSSNSQPVVPTRKVLRRRAYADRRAFSQLSAVQPKDTTGERAGDYERNLRTQATLGITSILQRIERKQTTQPTQVNEACDGIVDPRFCD